MITVKLLEQLLAKGHFIAEHDAGENPVGNPSMVSGNGNVQVWASQPTYGIAILIEYELIIRIILEPFGVGRCDAIGCPALEI